MSATSNWKTFPNAWKRGVIAGAIALAVILALGLFGNGAFSGEAGGKATSCISTTVEGEYKVMRNSCNTSIHAIVCENWMGQSGLGKCERKVYGAGREIANMAADGASVLTHAVAPSSVYIMACKAEFTPYLISKTSTDFNCQK